MRRKLPLILGFFAFFFYLLAFPRPALESARRGLLLWYRSVVPVLFPFMLLGNFALRTGLIYPLTAFLYRPLYLLIRCPFISVSTDYQLYYDSVSGCNPFHPRQ